MKLTKENTKILQSIAILFMFGLHLFNRYDISDYYDVHLYVRSGMPLLTYISYIFDACVPIYLFCSGYGLYISEKDKPSDFKAKFNRILRLLIRFWIILGLTCIVGYCLGMKEKYPGTVINLILNMLLIKSSYVGAFWFVQTYVLLVLLSGILFRLIKKHSYIIALAFSVIIYVAAFGMEYLILGKLTLEPVRLLANALMLLCRSQFSFVVGAIFAKEDIIDRNKALSKIRENKILVWMIVAIAICFRAHLAHMIFAPFSAIVLIVVLGTYEWNRTEEKHCYFSEDIQLICG